MGFIASLYLNKIFHLGGIADWAKEYTFSWNYRCAQDLYLFSNGCNSQLDVSGILNGKTLKEKRLIVKAGSKTFYTALDISARRVAAVKVGYGNKAVHDFYNIYLALERSRVWKHVVTLPGPGASDEIIRVWNRFLAPFEGLKYGWSVLRGGVGNKSTFEN